MNISAPLSKQMSAFQTVADRDLLGRTVLQVLVRNTIVVIAHSRYRRMDDPLAIAPAIDNID